VDSAELFELDGLVLVAECGYALQRRFEAGELENAAVVAEDLADFFGAKD